MKIKTVLIAMGLAVAGVIVYKKYIQDLSESLPKI